ncbi:hypothetical protein OF83DRAFT_240677 [Amylostereum chailletii]|nr:hypothetical protein OF83DRAFT_240677 [Amylostereum chailletii]
MDTPSFPLPRLRLARNGIAPHHDSENNTPTAGPSRLSPGVHHHLAMKGLFDDDDDRGDMEATPRLPVKSSLPSPQATSSQSHSLEPSVRLRALLRGTNDGSTSQTQLLDELTPSLPSERESDFDPPPKWNTTSASVALDTVKDIFSKALRDTPQKHGRRRSIDASGTEDSPRVERVVQERSRNKGKRRSLSDDDMDKSSKTSSSAANFEALRSRLLSSQGKLEHSRPPQEEASDHSISDMDLSDGPVGASAGTNTFLRQLNASSASVPAGSNTIRSLQFPSQIEDDNLLEQDSEMQRAMGAWDSYDGESTRHDRPLSFPPPRSKVTPLAARPRSSLVRTESLTENRLAGNLSRQPSRDLSRRYSAESNDISSRASSPAASSPSRPVTPHKDSFHHHRNSHSQTGSPYHEPRSGRNSAVSLRSVDSGSSSRTSSVGSNADYRDRVREEADEKKRERERAWNRPANALHRPTSALGSHPDHHQRTYSHPSRPTSALSAHTPDHSSQSSRAKSPNGSVHSFTSGSDDHVRERNWNSPHPHWSNPRRPLSPMPSPRPSPHPSPSHPRTRTKSLGVNSPKPSPQDQATVRAKKSPNSSSLSVPKHLSPRPVSPSPPPRRHDPRPSQSSPRLAPILPSAKSNGKLNGKINGKANISTPGLEAQFGFSFPRHRAPLPPLGFDHSSPERPRPSSRPNSTAPSHIPVRSPGKVPRVEKINGHPKPPVETFKKGHKRAGTEFSEANGAIPPRIVVDSEQETDTAEFSQDDGHVDSVRESDEDMSNTPVLRPISIPPPPEEDEPESRQHPTEGDTTPQEFTEPLQQTPSLSPPPSSPPLPQPSISDLFTPPRPSISRAPTVSFESPSPTKDLPELPPPPSSSDDDTADFRNVTPTHHDPPAAPDFSSMKTPRPPGAWMATPAPTRIQEPKLLFTSDKRRPRSNSLPQGTPPKQEDVVQKTETPSSASVRSNTLPTRTPAPPGAWIATPATAKRKSLMKVRFESVASDSAPSENGDAIKEESVDEGMSSLETRTQPLGAPQFDASMSMSDPSFNGVAESSPVPRNGGLVFNVPSIPETPKTPSEPSKRPRKSPSVRLVDEFGRERSEQTETASVKKDASRRDISRSMHMPGGQLMTPRNKSGVRMLDAMGREVDEPSENNDSEDTVTEERPSRPQALARVNKTTAEMGEQIPIFESTEVLPQDRSMALNEVFRSREVRSRMHSNIDAFTARTAEERCAKSEPRSRWSRLAAMLPQWSPWLYWTIFSLQLVIFLAVYHLSQNMARDRFVTTFFDPFYADLHLYVVKPDLDYNRNLFSFDQRPVSSTSYPQLFGPIASAWRSVHGTIAVVQRLIWDAWALDEQQRPRSWPPT